MPNTFANVAASVDNEFNELREAVETLFANYEKMSDEEKNTCLRITYKKIETIVSSLSKFSGIERRMPRFLFLKDVPAVKDYFSVIYTDWGIIKIKLLGSIKKELPLPETLSASIETLMKQLILFEYQINHFFEADIVAEIIKKAKSKTKQ